ncbi:chromosomal replication initiator protein DnaA [Fervidobacterium nodosum]|uniref:Chromosomal replication initiator protein DnaA n=1 Tax=Fervidobacterium nodosum (strain ATCC 35602 / DSM 5306 / Rt17-B1) TaxID=381764 RepID=A7HIZ1_FERNB|nr:chromosomal replication initiator protein DnaA [Fervidobacterium nodosum]ABS59874.1 chromosomal replication initiator protein DnaA [Fervidobacterium nodosum Rt17-B1]
MSSRGEKILSLLKERISRQQWESWFIDFTVKSVIENHVIFEVGNMFIKGYIEKKFDKIIRKVLYEVLGPNSTYEIVYAQVQKDEVANNDNGALVRKRPVLITPVSSRYTFSNFVVEEFNQLAYTILLESAKKLGTFNPIFIYSKAGMGKTHLVQAFGNYLLENDPDIRFAYLTSEAFMNELIAKLKAGTVEEFREKYRKKVDVLVIDDIQFLAGKKGVQIELFHTFNTLYEAGKQIIVCSDRSPKELKDFQDRVISRFQMGVVVEIKNPSVEAMYRIAKKIVEDEKADISDDILNYVAKHFKGSIRILKGAIIKLIAYKSMYKDLDVATARLILKDFLTEEEENHEQNDIISIVARYFKLSKEDLLSNKKSKNIVVARHLAMYILSTKFQMSSRKIATLLKKSHPTVLNGIKATENRLENDPEIRQILKLIEDNLAQMVGKALS